MHSSRTYLYFISYWPENYTILDHYQNAFDIHMYLKQISFVNLKSIPNEILKILKFLLQ